jgi:hypothetical protein
MLCWRMLFFFHLKLFGINANQGLRIGSFFSIELSNNSLTPAFKLGISVSQLFLGFSPD